MYSVPKQLYLGGSGIITPNNPTRDNEHAWIIESECDQIHVKSESIEIKVCCDHFNIDRRKYSGSAEINTVIDRSTFIVKFFANGNVTSAEFVIHWSCYYPAYNQTGNEGILWLGNYDNDEELKWNINSNCSSILLVSTHFDIEQRHDFLTIAGREYTGSGAIETIIEGSSFVATFNSDDIKTATGCIVLWSCLTRDIELQKGIYLVEVIVYFSSFMNVFKEYQ